MITKIENKLDSEFPEKEFVVSQIDTSKVYDIVEVHMHDDDHQIIFRQCIGGGRYDDLDEDEILDNSVEIVNRAMESYNKLDKANIIKEKKMIKVLDQMEAISFHKLTEEELAEKMKQYEISEKDFKKKE